VAGRMHAREKTRDFSTWNNWKREDVSKAEAVRCKQRAHKATQTEAGTHCVEVQISRTGTKHRATHHKMWLIKPLQRRLRVLR
jgi:hypothetical protein